MASEDNPQSGFNPKRRLCPDDTCIGVIGPDGRCPECGTRDAGSPVTAAAASPESPLHGDDREGDDRAEDAFADAASAAFDPKRRLCPDDTCIGVIGVDNRCSECGKNAS